MITQNKADMEDSKKDKTGFTVPEGYFEHLTDRIMDRVEQEEKPKYPKLMVMLRPYVWLAAMFVLAFIVKTSLPYFFDDERVVVSSTKASGNVVKQEDTEFSNDEIVEYLLSEVHDGEQIYAELY